MGLAEEAYEEAQRRIAACRAEGAEELELGSGDTRHLETLPPEIAELTQLTSLHLSRTKITDITPIAAITGLTSLYLNGTQITDITPIAAITGLTTLDLNETQITDITPIAAMTGLTLLNLSRTQITDITPIAAMTGLTSLYLDGTQITDIAPIAAMTSLTELDLSGSQVNEISALEHIRFLDFLALFDCPVTDLRPLVGHTYLAESVKGLGLFFKGCGATEIDARIHEISEIEDATERATALFGYLKDWVPPGGENDTPAPDLPEDQPAPLQTEIEDNRLVRAMPPEPPLPDGPVNDRARQGWAMICDFRDGFKASVNVGNYRPLAAALGSLDRALSGDYDTMNQIGVGTAGKRLSDLSQDASFTESLPDGSGTELASLAAAIVTFAERLPEWTAYLNDPTDPELPKDLAENIALVEEIGKTIKDAADVDQDVKDDLADQIERARLDPTSEDAAKGLIASIRATLHTLSENAILSWKLYYDGMRTKGKAVGARLRHEKTAMAKTGAGELRKAAFWLPSVIVGDILIAKGATLMMLAQRFPKQLSWIENVLRWIGVV